MANYSDSYVVVLIAFLIALLVEGRWQHVPCAEGRPDDSLPRRPRSSRGLSAASQGITYVLLYRTDKYKQLKDIIERGVKKGETVFGSDLAILLLCHMDNPPLQCWAG